MKWINVNEKYLNYLREYEKRIPRTDYGEDRYKPFFGILFETDELYYITQVSHPQERHQNMKSSLDFYKIYDIKMPEKLIAVINLNYMFPIPKDETYPFVKSEIDKYRKFKSNKEKFNYISLLDKELKAINQLDLSSSALKIYDIRNSFSNTKLTRRCLNYKQLEELAKKWIIKKNN